MCLPGLWVSTVEMLKMTVGEEASMYTKDVLCYNVDCYKIFLKCHWHKITEGCVPFKKGWGSTLLLAAPHIHNTLMKLSLPLIAYTAL